MTSEYFAIPETPKVLYPEEFIRIDSDESPLYSRSLARMKFDSSLNPKTLIPDFESFKAMEGVLQPFLTDSLFKDSLFLTS